MPELPEVETTKRGLTPHLLEQRIEKIVLRRADLRWPIPEKILTLEGQVIRALSRRAKYLLVHTDVGDAVWHLGMSGSLRVLPTATPVRLHDHVDWLLPDQRVLRFHDPRRFGSLLYQNQAEPLALLAHLGPEPLSDAFDADYLFRHTRARSVPIKHRLMDQACVVGVGNIYAAEALFQAGVRPQRIASKVTKMECQKLVDAIKSILQYAIERGGTTLRDFINPDGAPGYFEQELFVYGRFGEPCKRCAAPIKAAALGNRQSLFCGKCQR
jgi:formamidopyrimidine-DNA glycosylase